MVVLVKERILLSDNVSKMRRKTFTHELKDMWFSMVTLPPVIRQIVSIFLRQHDMELMVTAPVYHPILVCAFIWKYIPLSPSQCFARMVSHTVLHHNLRWRFV